MACPINVEELNKLKSFIAICNVKPEILNTPQLSFFKEFIEKLGGKVPAGEFKIPTCEGNAKTASASPPSDPSPPSPDESLSESESDVELDMEGVIEPDKDEPAHMGDLSKEPTDDEIDQASDFRSQAAAAYSEQKFDEAVGLYTKGIELNPGNALFYAKRGQAFLKLKKPNACICDCNRALELNCDSAAAYKFRGRAHRLLGNWESAAQDLRQACKLDFDEEADEWLKEVTPNAKKLEQHKIKQERKKTEKEIKKRQNRQKKAQEAHKRAQEDDKKGSADAGGPQGMPNLKNLFGNLDQAEVLSAFSDPEVSAAMQDILSNPDNISKYMGNPKILNLLCKFSGGGFPGAPGAPGAAAGFPGFPGAPPNATGPQAGGNPNIPKPEFTDDGLD